MGAKERLQQIHELVTELRKEYPTETGAFLNFMQAASAGPSLSAKDKELVNVALAVAAQCEWCIAFHVKGAVDAGATRGEIMEAAFQAVMMHGGPALMYLTPLREALDEFAPKE